MKLRLQILCSVLLLALLLLLGNASAHAQKSSYAMPWWTLDGGGDISSGSAYQIGGAIGQPDAGQSTSSNYTLQGGFWVNPSALAPNNTLFLPGILR